MSKSRVVFFFAFLALFAGLAVPATAQVVMSRTVTGLDGSGYLIPGTTELTFTVELAYTDPEGLTALAVSETIPAGWSLQSASGPCVANLVPAVGTENVLQFIWFVIPAFPCTFSYVLTLPSGETGPVDVTGNAEYRQLGDPLFSNVVTNTIQLEPTAVHFSRALSGDGLSGSLDQFYIPGQPITVDVTLTKTGTKAVTALAFEDLVPAGWTLQSVGGANPPNLSPAVGTAGPGPYQFVWFAIPSFPASFQYVIQPPAGATGQGCLAGAVQFRTDGGPESSPVDSVCLTDEPCMSLARGGDAFFSPGDTVDVALTLTKTCAENVTALAVEETIPAGWTFASVSGANQPNLSPAVGATGTLQFVWFAIPAFPATFTYTLNVPGDEAALSADISGKILYRLSGGPLESDVVLTTLSGQDLTPPAITVLPDNPLTLECGTAFVDPGATALDDRDGDITGAIVVGGDTVNSGVPGQYTITYNVEDSSGNAAVEQTRVVNVVDTTAPVAACQDVTVNLNATGTASVTAAQVDDGSSDSCGGVSLTLSQTAFNCNDIGANTVTLAVEDESGNVSTCDATVTVVDNLAPTAVCRNVTAQLSASGTASVTAAQVNNGSSDNCGIDTMTLSQTSFTCADLGANAVTLTVTDVNGNTSTCNATVNVVDSVAPVAACQDATVALDASGTATVTVGQVDDGSTDNCGAVDLSLSQTAFTCADLGPNTVTLTVEDGSGNTSSCTATVTVIDNVLPVALCRDATVNLNASGTASVTAAQVNNGSSDNCGTVDLTLSQTAFTCADLGANTVTLTVEDGSGNIATCEATVTVVDGTAPVITLLGASSVTVECGDVYTDAGATAADNCDGDLSASVSVSGSVDTSTPGTYTLQYNVSDDSGNAAQTRTRTVQVRDTVAPAITLLGANPVTQDCTGVYTDAGATVSDECDGAATLDVNTSNVNPDAAGTYTVVYTAEDASGNTSSATRTVIVQGTICDLGICDITGIAFGTTVSDSYLIPSVPGSVNVTLTAAVTFTGPCVPEVTYEVDGVVAGNSTDEANSYPVAVNLAAGTHTITATALDPGTGETATVAMTVEVVIGVDANGDGYLDDPFGGLPDDGDTWGAEVDSTNCDRAVAMVSWFGGVAGGPVTATVVNPADPSQVVTVTVPRGVLAAGEQGILIVAVSCDLPSLLAPADAGELTGDLPGGAVAGGAYVEVSVIVSADGGATFDEIDPALIAANPVRISLSGVDVTPGYRGTFLSHPTFVNSDAQFGVVLEPETGTWSEGAIEDATLDDGTLTAETTSLSAFGPFELIPLGPTLKVTPNPAFTRIVGIVSVGASVDVTFTVKNVGSGTVSGAATLTGGDGAFTLVGQTAYTLTGSQTRQITLRFTPAAAQDYAASLRFTSGADAVTVNVRGTGTTQKACQILGCGAATATSSGLWADALVLLGAAALLLTARLRQSRAH